MPLVGNNEVSIGETLTLPALCLVPCPHTGYISIVMFSTAIPGAPVWAQPPAVFDEIFQVGLEGWGQKNNR